MYCRRCNYNLSGQKDPRCSECGSEFAFDDPATYRDRPMGRPARIMAWLRQHRRIPILILTLALLVGYGFAYSKLPKLSYAMSPHGIAGRNMKLITVQWHIQIATNPNESEFDRDAAVRELQHLYSPFTEARTMNAKAMGEYLLRNAPILVIPTILYLLLLSTLVEKPTRRRAYIFIAILLLLLIPCIQPSATLNWLFPGTNAFMDDIAFIPGVDITPANPNRNDTITMYCIHPSKKPYPRLGIAFGDGHVQWEPLDRARELFAAQGIPFPKLDE